MKDAKSTRDRKGGKFKERSHWSTFSPNLLELLPLLEENSQDLNAECIVSSTVEQLLREVHREFTTTGKLSEEVLSALNFVFQAPILPALDLVDGRNVTLVSCPSGRKVYQVVGSSGTPYTCLISSQYCSCPAYRFSVLQKDDHSMCKHTLAVKLSEAMGLCKTLDVSDQDMVNILSHLD